MRWSFAAAIFVAACFAPTPPDGALLCSTSGACPDGYKCIANACWKNGSGPTADGGEDLAIVDLGMEDFGNEDLAITGDLSAADMASLIVSAHELDTGMVAGNTMVTISNLVVTAPVIFYSKNASTLKCRYQGFLQDANGIAPDGVQIFVTLTNCDPAGIDGGDCTCPAAGATGTGIDALTTIGDVFTVTGVYQLFVASHQLVQVTQTIRTGTGHVVAPVVFSDPTLFAPSGSGFVSYEAMLVQIQPISPFTISAVDGSGNFSGAGVSFAGSYRSVYGMGGSFPAASSTWHSIAGVADNAFTGSVLPREMTDFSP